jgi:phage terminase large subunit GpA-like protein
VHFSIGLDEEFFAQLTAEKLVTKFRKGFSVMEWVKTRERNEALDCFAYAYAALNNLNPDLLKVRARKIAPPLLAEESIPTSTQRKTRSAPKRKSSSFVSRW